MARIAGVDLPREKRIEIGLTYIYGIGRPSADKILAQANVNPDTRVRDLTDDEVKRIVASSSMESRTGKLVSVDKDKIKLTIGSTTYSYDISSGAKVKVDGDDMELSKFINIYVMKDYTVTITRNAEGKATKIVATSK